jgi:hypothetical protein
LKTMRPTWTRGLLLLVEEKCIKTLTGGGSYGSEHLMGLDPDQLKIGMTTSQV